MGDIYVCFVLQALYTLKNSVSVPPAPLYWKTEQIAI